MDFQNLTKSIIELDKQLTNRAKQSINICVTIRNWLFGYYIQEYELGGNDRAKYGERLLESLSEELQRNKIPSSTYRSLKLYKQFYQSYSLIGQTVFAQLITDNNRNADNSIISPTNLIKSFSFSHFVELMKIEDDLKRNFYELECVKSNWSVRELKRQIASLYFERTALSKDKKKLVEYVRATLGTNTISINDTIRDPYIFEFLGLKPKEVIYESDLQRGLLDKLQDFLLEFGNGVCFEARNKLILIGDNYYFIDLVLYHRILKCNILVELKMTG